MTHKAVFLDRDGVINIDHGYVYQPEEFEFVPGVFEACQKFHALGYLIVVVTNQSGIGRGYYTVEDFNTLSIWMRKAFQAHDIPIAAIEFCPHHPEKATEEYLKDCECRKPRPGMLIKAAEDWDIDLSQSIMIGDKCSDMQAAQASGVPMRVLVAKNGEKERLQTLNCPEATHHFLDLQAFSHTL
ncbi:D-glycero-beta-D-manno-heptose 1,7-bisphosphate 7-phosphatase [Algicola sagamiensis]|uniref:D-glycero-beta-D-manno-heptose 1,7-bisphosphate 7-phosphatase n=1 Tax=Algicola sagamiensis TaxID=163869 RepID=UPI00035F912F|nr:D-glycero-beta-D-manno-heptose 1,7-bisphosphate 7-phosphatase [Algicola sagamiensis]